MLFVIGLCNIVNAKNDKQINKNVGIWKNKLDSPICFRYIY